MANNNLLEDDDDVAKAVYRFKNKEADEQQATMVDRRRPENKKCIADRDDCIGRYLGTVGLWFDCGLCEGTASYQRRRT